MSFSADWQVFLFRMERMVVAAKVFNVKVSGVDVKTFQHIFSAIMEQ